MEEQSKKYTAFAFAGISFGMSSGLHSAPAQFQWNLDSTIGPELEPFALAYLDDISIPMERRLDENLTKIYNEMPFGLHSAPAPFQRDSDSTAGPKFEPFAITYLDDISILVGGRLDEDVTKILKVFRRLRSNRVRKTQRSPLRGKSLDAL